MSALQKFEMATSDAPSLISLSTRAFLAPKRVPGWCGETVPMLLADGHYREADAVLLSDIRASGRIEKIDLDNRGNGWFPHAVTNMHSKIDGARLDHYDPETRTVHIRVDHSTHPSFYLELDINLDKLEHWLGHQIDDADAPQ